MTTLPPGIPFSQDVPVESVKRAAVAVPAGHVSNLAAEDSTKKLEIGMSNPSYDSHEEWQSRLRSLQQWICELLIKNQQLRLALMEMKERLKQGQ